MKINTQNKNSKRKKHKGFLLFVVIIISIIMLSVIFAVTLLSRAHSNDIVSDTQRSKSYYIANAGAEMAYAALVEANILESGGSRGFNIEKDNIMTKDDLFIRNKAGEILGYVDLSVDLKKMTVQVPGGGTDTRWYYRILSNGKLEKDDNPNKPTDTHYVTMFIFCDDPSSAKIYDGNVQNP